MSNPPTDSGPAFLLYCDRFLSSTITMTQAEVGSYIRLLAWQWVKGFIPNEIDKVERIAGGSVTEEVIQKFELCEDGLRRNKRLEIVRSERSGFIASQRKKSQLGVEARMRRKLLPPGQPPGQPAGQPRVSLGLHLGTNSGVESEKSGVACFTDVNNRKSVGNEEFTFDDLPENGENHATPGSNPGVNPRSTSTSTSTLNIGSNSIMGGLDRKSLKEDAGKVLAYLNQKAGRNFRESDSNITTITARLREKDVSVEGIMKMIDRQVARWVGTEFEEYLRPETLFAPRKFGSYYDMRDQPIPGKIQTSGASQNQSAPSSARDLRGALAILKEQIATHPANREFIGSAEFPTKEQKDDLRSRRAKVAEIEAQLATTIINAQ